MAQLSFLYSPQKDKEILKEELSAGSLKGKDLDAVFSFLTGNGCTSLSDVDFETVISWRSYVRSLHLKKQAAEHYMGLLEIAMMHFLEPSFPELCREIDEKHHFSRAEKNKVKAFLMMMGIKSLAKITYHTRKSYERFLLSCDLENPRRYLKVLDQIKLSSIRAENELRPFQKKQFSYRNDVFYLGYHPDYETAMEFYYVRNKEELVFDFSIDAPAKLKHQIFEMLSHCLLIGAKRKNLREMYIVPLKLLYLYCAGAGIPDIEAMEQEDVDGFKKSLQGKCGTKTKVYMQIINSTRRFLFLSSPKTNWDANVWYMDRFTFKLDRLNPAYHIDQFSFCTIKDKENRDLFKSFMKKLIGISHRALNTVQGKYTDIRVFLLFCDRMGIKAKRITPGQMDAYMDHLDEKGNGSITFNKHLNALLSFYGYLEAKGEISKIPFQGEYYRKKEYYLHNDRTLGRDLQMDILGKLNLFPEHLRLMCIILWATGLRINEVCTLQGDAFSFEDGDTYLKAMQYKQVLEKKIPIPSVLYRVMSDYIEKNRIGNDEYIFKNKKGGAYYASTFRSQMQRLCRAYGIGEGDYVFRPHDFRHTVGTEMFDFGVSLQAIRDYHGHRNENMTKQYIDYMPAKVNRANKEYFKDNLLLGAEEGEE